jgi:hypothetical protein
MLKRLAICLPQTDTVRREYARSLANMMLHLGNRDAGVSQVFSVHGTSSILPSVRQELAERAISRGATHLLWIDADHSFPHDTAHRLLARQRPWVGINATTRNPPLRTTALKGEGVLLDTTKHSRGLEKVWRMGFGLVLIEARVFEAMRKPWFLIEYVEKDDGAVFRGEDVYFCEKAKAAGFHPMVDHDLTKETAHVGSVPWTTAALETETEPTHVGGHGEVAA